MATPTVVTVTGTFHDGNGDPAIGFVVFSSPVTLLNVSLDETLSPQRVKVELDENGEISAELYATDDPGWSPDYTWKVIEVIRGRPNNEYHIELTMADTTVVLEDLTPVESVEEFAGYIPLSQKGVANGVASLNNLGKVPSSQLPPSGGGGGSAVDSVNGEVGDVVLDYADVGAAPTVHAHDYSPTSHNHDSVYSPTGHTHDDRYFTEEEVSTSLSGKSDTSHNHDSDYATTGHLHDTRYYTETEADALLAGKSSTSHNHDSAYATTGHGHTGMMTTTTYDPNADGIVVAAGQVKGSVYFQGAVAKGDPVYVTGVNGSDLMVNKANANSASTMPAIGCAVNAQSGGTTGEVVLHGLLSGLDTSGYSLMAPLYVASGGGLTTTRPSSNIQFLGVVLRVGGGDGVIGLAPDGVKEIADVVGLQTALDAKASTSDLSTHAADTTSIHGIADTSVLATDSDVSTEIFLHNSDTTAVHGIADTSDLIIEGDARLTDARTPTAHNHAGADINSGTVATARLDTGTSGSQVALGNHTHSHGAWQNLTVGTNISSSGSPYSTASARDENGVTRLRGRLEWSAATIAGGALIATIPSSSLYPVSQVQFSVRTTPTSNVSTLITIETDGQIRNEASFGTTTSGAVALDGMTFPNT